MKRFKRGSHPLLKAMNLKRFKRSSYENIKTATSWALGSNQATETLVTDVTTRFGLDFHLPLHPHVRVLIAFKDYNPLKGVLGSEWIGFEEFTKFLSSPNFGTLLANTLKLSVYGLLLGFLPPIILAIMLNQLLSDKAKNGFNWYCTHQTSSQLLSSSV